jgi:DNA-binding protein HU-beta
LKKQEIIEKIVNESGKTRKEINHIIDIFFECIKKSIDRGERVEIRGFGTFYRAERKERKVFSPIAGKHLDLPAKSVLAFKASKSTEIEKQIKGA